MHATLDLPLPAHVSPLSWNELERTVGGITLLGAIGAALLVTGVALALFVGAAVIGGVVYAMMH